MMGAEFATKGEAQSHGIKVPTLFIAKLILLLSCKFLQLDIHFNFVSIRISLYATLI